MILLKSLKTLAFFAVFLSAFYHNSYATEKVDENVQEAEISAPSEEAKPAEMTLLENLQIEPGANIQVNVFRPGSDEPKVFSISSPELEMEVFGDRIEISGKLEGFEADEIEVLVKEKSITVKAEKDMSQYLEGAHADVLSKNIGSFSQTFEIPEVYDTRSLVTRHNDGFLTLRIMHRIYSEPAEKEAE